MSLTAHFLPKTLGDQSTSDKMGNRNLVWKNGELYFDPMKNRQQIYFKISNRTKTPPTFWVSHEGLTEAGCHNNKRLLKNIPTHSATCGFVFILIFLGEKLRMSGDHFHHISWCTQIQSRLSSYKKWGEKSTWLTRVVDMAEEEGTYLRNFKKRDQIMNAHTQLSARQ